MYRFVLSAALAAGLLVPGMAAAAFADVPAAHRFSDAIAFIEERGIVSGYADGMYRPERTINRAEFTKILVSASIDNETINACVQKGMSFIDVPTNAWYSKAICIAKERGIVSGYEDASFGPDRTIRFAEAAAMIVRAYALPQSSSLTWWEAAIDALAARDALPPTYRDPEQLLTRGEMAAMIAAVYDGQDR